MYASFRTHIAVVPAVNTMWRCTTTSAESEITPGVSEFHYIGCIHPTV